ncbi:MAG TPA: hypothetical protein VMY06_06280 [Sedimentisphaerales bacterium]|nr:hypothetical protein [Sedimentisphaerales bacterium]
MNSKFKKVCLLAVCMCLILGPLAIAADSGKQESVLSRLQTINDDELGELIRIALDNLPETKALMNPPYRKTQEESNKLESELQKAEETAKSKAIRGVTEVYSQIKLLDTQIEHTEQKINSLTKNSAIRIEMILARAELDARRTTKLAELREIMNILPKHAFGRKLVTDLKSWFRLDVIDDYVYVIKCLKPYYNDTQHGRYQTIDPVKCMSEEDAIRYVHELIKKQEQLPLRVDISRNIAGSELSKQIRERIIKMVKNENMQLEVEVYLEEKARSSVYKREWFLKDGKTYYSLDRLKLNRPTDLRGSFEDEVSEHLKYVGSRSLPAKYKIEYDAESKDLAFRANEAVKETAKKYGVTQFVEIELREFDPNALSD